jgi:hypothetical protein
MLEHKQLALRRGLRILGNGEGNIVFEGTCTRLADDDTVFSRILGCRTRKVDLRQDAYINIPAWRHQTMAYSDIDAAGFEVLGRAVLERYLTRRVLGCDVRTSTRLQDLLLTDMADCSRIGECRRARHSSFDIFEGEDLVGITGFAGQELERSGISRRDVIAVVEACRSTCYSKTAIGGVVEADVKLLASKHDWLSSKTYCVFPSLRQ